jgi:hypothetical protein
MTDNHTLDELARRRAAFKDFAEAVEEDIKRIRIERLAAEKNAIRTLVLTAAAEGKTLGQIKRAYGTSDHRTISDMVKGAEAEVIAIKTAKTAEVTDKPEWFVIQGEEAEVSWEGDTATYTWQDLEDGSYLFMTETPLWDESYTHKNEAVSLLDGKTESDSAEARVLAKFIRKH